MVQVLDVVLRERVLTLPVGSRGFSRQEAPQGDPRLYHRVCEQLRLRARGRPAPEGHFR